MLLERGCGCGPVFRLAGLLTSFSFVGLVFEVWFEYIFYAVLGCSGCAVGEFFGGVL